MEKTRYDTHIEVTCFCDWNEEKQCWETTNEILFADGEGDENWLTGKYDIDTCDELVPVESIMKTMGLEIPWDDKK